MKIVTVHIKREDLDKIKQLLKRGLYPSRSELVRLATKMFLIKELKRLKELPKKNAIDDNFDDEHYVRIPNDKTYKIIKRLV